MGQRFMLLVGSRRSRAIGTSVTIGYPVTGILGGSAREILHSSNFQHI